MPQLIKDHLLGTIRDARGALLESIIIFTAIELCGSFITGKTGVRQTKSNFLAFWKSKYMPQKYHELGGLLYEIFRNGVSHSFIAKGGVIPSGDTNSSNLHLVFTEYGIFIYIPQFKDDVIIGVTQLLDDLKKNKNDLKAKYNSVLLSLTRDGKFRYDTFVRTNNISIRKIPLSGDINSDVNS